MKVLIFVDLHDDDQSFLALKEKAKSVEIILGAGDYSLFGHNLREVLEKINSLNKPTYLIHGNHESSQEMINCMKGLKNLIFIHKKQVKYKDLLITGYGGDGFSEIDVEAEIFFKSLKNKGGIILFHGPPFATALDELIFGHVGNESYNLIIEDFKPKLVVCGHLHENFKKSDSIGESIIINPGPDGEVLNV